MPQVKTGDRVHSKGIETFSRVLGHYTAHADDSAGLALVTALASMMLLPAKPMAGFAAVFTHKGRLRESFDVDITAFDFGEITDMATFQQSLRASKGIHYVLVNGEFVRKGGRLVQAALPGQLIKGSGVTTIGNR